MIAAWMLYGALIGALLGAGALLTEWALLAYRKPARWIWAGALALSVVALAAGPLVSRDAPARAGAAPAHATSSSGNGTIVQTSVLTQLDALRPRLAVLDIPLALLWGLSSVLLAATLVFTHRRLRRDRARWPLRPFAGGFVRESDGLGPAVVGCLHPEIVVPSWAFGMDEDSQRLIALHEGEHLRAGDQRLLAAALMMLVVAPWNPALWWHLRRLRLALEIDCDRRALRAGAPRGAAGVRRYGELLVRLGERTRMPLVPIAALTEGGSWLVRRVRAFTAPPPRARAVRAAAACGAAAMLLGGAAASPAPSFASTGRANASPTQATAVAIAVPARDTIVRPVSTRPTRVTASPRSPEDSLRRRLERARQAYLDTIRVSPRRPDSLAMPQRTIGVLTDSTAARPVQRTDSLDAGTLRSRPIGVQVYRYPEPPNDSTRLDVVRAVGARVDTSRYLLVRDSAGRPSAGGGGFGLRARAGVIRAIPRPDGYQDSTARDSVGGVARFGARVLRQRPDSAAPHDSLRPRRPQ